LKATCGLDAVGNDQLTSGRCGEKGLINRGNKQVFND